MSMFYEDEIVSGKPHPKKNRVNLGIAQKGEGSGGVGVGGVETIAQIVCGSSSVNINHY